MLGFGGHSTLPHHIHFPLWKFIEYVNITGMDPWEAAVKSFGSDGDFLQFNCLSIAFKSKGMIFIFLYMIRRTITVGLLPQMASRHVA